MKLGNEIFPMELLTSLIMYITWNNENKLFISSLVISLLLDIQSCFVSNSL